MPSPIKTKDKPLVDAVTALAQWLCDHPEAISAPPTADIDNDRIHNAQDAFNHAMDALEFEESSARSKTLAPAAEQLNAIGSEDLVLVKSISRFARNTVDCLNYTRALRALGIAVIFEKENINTMDAESEMLITMMGAFAQAESESISQNVTWGVRQAMREGRASIQYKHLYAFRRGGDGKPEIIPEQAEVVRRIYDSFLAGRSVRMIKAELEREGVPASKGGTVWSESVIRGILKNEKYCGDVLRQKTFTPDCISHKAVRNVGQLPMYLVQDHHEGIVSRDTFKAVQAEFARRNAGHAPSRKLAPTGRSCYSAKYALTGMLVCGECGTLYRRCVWTKRGRKQAVWRCANRIDYGAKYCHESPTIKEEPLQNAVLAAINQAMSQREVLVAEIEDAMRMELIPVPGTTMSVGDIDRQIEALNQEFQTLFAAAQKDGGYLKHADTFKRITSDISDLKNQRAALLARQSSDSASNRRVADAVKVLSAGSAEITGWDESLVRQLVETVRVLSADRISVRLRGGMEIERELEGV